MVLSINDARVLSTRSITMKNKMFATALLALTVAASGSAFAQRGDDHGNDRNNGRDNGQQQRNNDQRGNSEAHRNDGGQHYVRDDSRGAGPRHDMRRGQRLSQEYRDNRYVVNDWRARRLSAPPRGQHWVRAGDDYVLASIATGIIAQVLLNN
jgi:Ni/Co efflux regulator RcnB